MSLPLTNSDLRQRSLRLASLIADDLVSRQTSDGQFKQPDFYAKAFAVNLWTRLDHLRYAKNIERALTALKSDRQDKSYHREFIEYALLDTLTFHRTPFAQFCETPRTKARMSQIGS